MWTASGRGFDSRQLHHMRSLRHDRCLRSKTGDRAHMMGLFWIRRDQKADGTTQGGDALEEKAKLN